MQRLCEISEALRNKIMYACLWHYCKVESLGEAGQTTGFIPFDEHWLEYPCN